MLYFFFGGWVVNISIVWVITAFGLLVISPFCVIFGIVFGILGRNTEGWLYAYTGLVLSLLCGLPCLVVVSSVCNVLVPY